MAKETLKVAVVQMDPKVEMVSENIKNAEKLIESLSPGSAHLLCFPEMAFTGYVFPSFSSIEPYLETRLHGPTSMFCAGLAKRLKCHVVAGYPERVLNSSLDENEARIVDNLSNTPLHLARNSSTLFGPDGICIGEYHKTNLYELDVPWAQAGTGFKTFTLPPPLHKVSIAICMDLNPQPPADWTGSGPPHELADYCIAEDVRLLILLCAWRESDQDPHLHTDVSTLNYWCRRLEPLWREDDTVRVGNEVKETIVVIVNRTGFERGTPFCGSSTMLRLIRGSGSPEVVGVLGRAEEKCRVWTVEI